MRIIAFFYILISSVGGIAQTKFSGVVLDSATLMPLEGTSLYIGDLKKGTTSDHLGRFSMTVPAGKHFVEISHIGYKTIAEKFDVKSNVDLVVKMQEAIVENNAVVITGASLTTRQKAMPISVSVVNNGDLMRSTAANLVETLTRVPGISSISTGPAISKPIIRGLGYNRVLTIEDGVRQEGQQWGDEHGLEIDDNNIGKVELLRGPASLIYGSDAMAGVINIISNVNIPEKSIRANLGGNYQSNSRLKDIYGNAAMNKNGFTAALSGSYKASGDYKNKYDGYVTNSAFNSNKIAGQFGKNGNKGFSTLLLSNFHLNAGVVEGERDDAGNLIKNIANGATIVPTTNQHHSSEPGVPMQSINHFKITLDNNYAIGKNRLLLTTGWQQNRRSEFGNPNDLKEKELEMVLESLTYTLQYRMTNQNNFKFSIGSNGMLQNNKNGGVAQLIPDYNLADLGLFVFSQKKINKLHLSGGLRLDTRQVNVKQLMDGSNPKSASFKTNFSNFSASVGGACDASDKVNIKLNIAKAFRAPTIAELASNGAHEGTFRYEYGNGKLKSETSLQTDASIDITSEHYSMNLAGYLNLFNNFIYYSKLSNSNGLDSIVQVDGASLIAFQFNQQKTLMRGFEFSLDFHPHPIHWFHFANSISLVRGTFVKSITGEKDLPYMPAPKWLTEIRADIKQWKMFSNSYIKLEVENTFKQSHTFSLYNTETATKGYSLLNFGFGGDVANKRSKTIFTFGIGVNNLLDATYQNHLSRLKYTDENLVTGRQGVFNQGRNVSLKINVPLKLNLAR